MFTYTDVDVAKAAFDQALTATAHDLGVEETDPFAWDICVSVVLECDAATAYELCRTELGAIPLELEQIRPDVAAYAARRPIEF